jgi:arabinogalactan endo-1,4-beta-galactosidase
VVIFLSENWADMVKQPVPKVWKDLNVAAKSAAIEAYAERVARHFADAGVHVDLFEIGNEIDFGLCGVLEEEWPKRVSIPYMQLAVWSKMTPMILAAERGVNKVRPNAKFILHLAQWNKPDYCAAFWQTMITDGVQVDYAGLSYFPTAAEPKERLLAFFTQQVDAIAAAIKRPVLVCESGYPSMPDFPGQFTDWNKPIPGYTLDDAGQAKWLADYLTAARGNPHVAGSFYWSPEWYDSEMWSAFSLFDSAGKAKPAMRAFGIPLPTTNPTNVQLPHK